MITRKYLVDMILINLSGRGSSSDPPQILTSQLITDTATEPSPATTKLNVMSLFQKCDHSNPVFPDQLCCTEGQSGAVDGCLDMEPTCEWQCS
jgi:hypothetical protein